MSTNSSEAMKKKTPPPKLITTNIALKLAEQWVNSMSKCVEDESIDEEMEGRPLRLGLGAKVPRQTKVLPSNDPVERKLLSKFAKMRKDARDAEESAPDNNDEDEDEDEESRTSSFAKRKTAPSTITPLQAKKKFK